jgi:hypothetical protein
MDCVPAKPGRNPVKLAAGSEVLFADSGKENSEAQRTTEGTDSNKGTNDTKGSTTQGPL